MVANNAFIIEEMEERAAKRGELEVKYEIAKKLLDVLDNETIAIKTGLEISEVIKLRNMK
ncbi:MAG: hypothetical protein ACRC6T_05855 [Sarcina sp.]